MVTARRPRPNRNLLWAVIVALAVGSLLAFGLAVAAGESFAASTDTAPVTVTRPNCSPLPGGHQ